MASPVPSACDDAPRKGAFRRNIGLVANFSLGFTYLSPLTGIYALFAFALTIAGPPAIWWILLIAAGQMLVALVFGEVASQYPITGGLYPWTRRLWGRRYAWLAAWIYLCAIVVTVTSVAEYSTTFIASLFGYEPTATRNLVAALGILLLALIFNLSGTKTLARVARIGFWAEMTGVIGLGIYLLVFARVHSFSIMFDAMGIVGANGSYLSAFVGAALLGLWMFFGFEACGNVAEEVENASRKIPKAMILTILFGAISAVVSFAGYLLATPNLAQVVDGTVKDPITDILKATLGPVGGRLFLIVALTAFVSCVMSLQAALSRLIFSFARDNMMPGSDWLKQIHRKNAVPNNAMVVACVLPILICLLVFGLPDSLARVTAFAVMGIYASFGMVVFAAMRQRIKGWKPAGEWTLGMLGWPINVAALAFQIFGMFLLARPGGKDLAFSDRWIVLMGLAVVVGIGLAYMLLAKPYGKSDAPEGDAVAYARALRESATNRRV